MKRKLLISLLVFISCLTCVFGFAACGDNNPENSGNGQGTVQIPPEEKPDDKDKPTDVLVTGVTLNKTALTLEEGESETLIATVVPNNATDKTVTWKSSDSSVAKVEKGKVTALKAGTATITATAGGKSATCKVTVTEKSAPHIHTLTLVPAKDADCETAGNTAYYICDCGKWFSDAEAKNEIADKNSVNVKATGHSYSKEWTFDETQHWHKATCSHATVTSAKQNHNFKNNVCTVCGYINDLLVFKTLEVSDDTVYGKVSNATTEFSFIKEVTANTDVTYTVSTDKACKDTIPSKTVDLKIGDNVFYLLVTNGNDLELYTVTVRRRPVYTLSFNTNGGVAVKSQQIEEDNFATEPQTERTGYAFVSWDYDFTKPVLKSTTISASWAANAYTLTFDVNGGDALESNSHKVTYDQKFNLPTPTRTGYTFLGWFNGETKVDISSEKSQFATNTSLTAHWQANSYKLTLESSDSNRGSVSGAGNYDYDSKVTVTANTNSGYTFIGWYDGERLLSNKVNYTFKMGLAATYKAKWCKVTMQSDNANCSITALDGIYVVGEEVTVKAINIGYTFIGWYNGETELTKGLSLTFNMPTEDTTYTAKWIKVTVQADNANCSVTVLNGTYIVGEKVTVTATTSIGYTFIGWYNGETELTKELSLTFNMPAEDTTYTAKWNVNDEMSNFEFTSTATTCQITGIKDKTVTSVIIPNSVTSIGGSAFYGCSGLESITVNENNIAYSSQSGILYNKAKTAIVYVPGAIKGEITLPDSVTSIRESAFSGCSGLESITIPDSVTSIGDYAFRGCSGLTSISIPDNVTSVGGGLFYGCKNLTYVKLNNNITSLQAYSKLEFNYYLQNYEYIYYGFFAKCSSLASIIIPDSVKSIGNSAFNGCSSLASIIIPDSVKSIGNSAFNGCSSLTSITIPGSVTNIGSSAFNGCSSLTNITIPDSVTSIGGSAFSGCSGLESITLPFVGGSIKTSNDTYQYPFGYVFGMVSYTGSTQILQEYHYSSTISTEKSTYYLPSSLKNVTITGGNILYGAFDNCRGLTDITILDSVRVIEDSAFKNCSSLTSITIPDSVTSINDSAFYNCSSLTSITIPSVIYIEDKAFSGCSSLANITFGNRVKSISASSFYGCSSLTSVTIPDSVTSIGKQAFEDCSALASITFGNRVKSIGERAFSGCSSLTEINYGGTKVQWNAIIPSPGTMWNYNTGYYTIHCTDGDIAKS